MKLYTRGRRVSQGGFTLGVLGLTILLLLGVSQHAGAARVVCPVDPPGPRVAHWVDTCSAGIDSFPSSFEVWVQVPGIDHIILRTGGKSLVQRGDPIDTPDLLDPGHFNKINTGLSSLAFGSSPAVGDFAIAIGTSFGSFGLPPSVGMIIEKTGPGTPDCDFPADPTMACSFFDVFHLLLLDSNSDGNFETVLHNNAPIRVTAMIDRVPPFYIPYRFDGPPVELFDGNNNPTGIEILHVIHTPVPEPSTLLLFVSGLAGLIGLGIRRRRSQKA